MERGEILTVAAAEAGGHYGDLSLALVWGPEGAVLETKVLCAVEDGCTLSWEGDGRHVDGGGGLGAAGRVTESGRDKRRDFIAADGMESREERVLKWTVAGPAPPAMSVPGPTARCACLVSTGP